MIIVVTDETQDAAKESSLGGWGIWVLACGGMLILYVFSIGPVMRLHQKGIIAGLAGENAVGTIYGPLGWKLTAYTWLRKPHLREYLHVWALSRDAAGRSFSNRRP